MQLNIHIEMTGGRNTIYRDEDINESGLPHFRAHFRAHGLCKTKATILAESGATVFQMMPSMGWTAPRQAQVYTRKADAEKFARQTKKYDAIGLKTPHFQKRRRANHEKHYIYKHLLELLAITAGFKPATVGLEGF